MNNVTTFETAALLKAAGFPQPIPAVGQVWYDDLKRPVCVRAVFPEYISFSVLNSLENMSGDNEFVSNHCAFAPTATDILRELGDTYCLVSVNEGMFICKKGMPVIGDNGVRDNPAEAAALAWLNIHKKIEQQ